MRYSDKARARPPVAAVSFDLDGTLIESTEAILECFVRTFDFFDDDVPSAETIRRSISIPLEDQFRALTLRDADECAKVYRRFYAEVGPAITVLMPGARACLERLRSAGLRLGVATSKGRAAAEMLLEHLGVMEFFDLCVGPDDVTHPKPHPESLYKCLEALSVSAEEMYFVGDTEYDVKAALAAGVGSLCVTTGYRTSEQLLELGPEAVFPGLPEVADYVLQRV